MLLTDDADVADNAGDWTEYKTMRQYQTIGGVLEEMRTYGYSGAIEMLISNGNIAGEENGHDWISRDQDV